MLVELLLSWKLPVALLGVALAYVVFWYVREFCLRKFFNHPDGPYGVPILGIIPFGGTDIHLTFVEAEKRYGPIMYSRMGMQKMVILNDYNDIKEALNLHATAGREPSIVSSVLDAANGTKNLFFRTNDAGWRLSRKTGARAISLFTNSKSSRLEPFMEEATEMLLETLRAHEGQPMDMKTPVAHVCSRIMGAVLFGRPPRKADDLVEEVEKALGKIIDPSMGTAFFLDMLRIPVIVDNIVLRLIQPIAHAWHSLALVCEKAMAEAKSDGDIQYVIDAIRKSVKQADPQEMARIGVGKKQLESVTFDMFGAGVGDVPENTSWCFLLLSHHPDVLRRAQEELDTVVGRDATPSLSSIDDLPYNHGLVYETLRFITTSPFFPHMASEEFTFRGYKISKNTKIMANWWAANHDERIYSHPMKFDPGRYVTPEGKFNTALASKLLTFSTGQRRCLGENIAKSVMFLMITRMIQNFDIAFHDEGDPEPLRPMFTLSLSSKPHKLVLTARPDP